MVKRLEGIIYFCHHFAISVMDVSVVNCKYAYLGPFKTSGTKYSRMDQEKFEEGSL